ncbi:MAG: hypothetical protein ACHQVK_03105 [Candidatus Paceibacterales bacterium]
MRNPRQLDPNKPLEKQAKEWYFNDPNIKYIMEHWNISPEHPGMEYAKKKYVLKRGGDAVKILFLDVLSKLQAADLHGFLSILPFSLYLLLCSLDTCKKYPFLMFLS